MTGATAERGFDWRGAYRALCGASTWSDDAEGWVELERTENRSVFSLLVAGLLVGGGVQKYLILASLKPISMIFEANFSSGAEVSK